MPTYVYRCPKGHIQQVQHGMLEDPTVVCRCSEIMHRVPQVPAVNWNGLPPHLEGTRSTKVQQFIDSAPDRRAKYLDTKGNKNG